VAHSITHEVIQLPEDGAEFRTCDGKLAVPICGEVDPHGPIRIHKYKLQKTVAEIFNAMEASACVKQAALLVQTNE
jgi:hypothetical protein